VTSFGGFLRSAREELPEAPLARWASVLFSLSVLTLLISLAAAQIFLAAATIAFALHLLRDRRVPAGAIKSRLSFPPLKLPLALFGLLSLMSAAWAGNPAGWLAMRKLVLFLIWLLAVNLILNSKHLALVYKGLFLESALAGLVAAGQFIAQYRVARAVHPELIYFYMTTERVRGFMGHWMNFGGQQMLVFAALLSFLLLAARPRRIWWAIFAVVGISIVLNFSRGVWLGGVVATFYVVARWKPRWLWALPLLLLLGYLAAPPLVRQRLRVLRHPGTDPSLAIRFEMWQVGSRMIREHPLLGVGPNNIELAYTSYAPAGKALVVGYHGHLHNNFLQLAAERGLPCLAAWVWMMAALAWHFVMIRRRLGREGRSTWIADAALAAWLAFVVEGCFEYNFGASSVLMLFLFVSATPFVLENRLEAEG
jgi:O-antigen ligase